MKNMYEDYERKVSQYEQRIKILEQQLKASKIRKEMKYKVYRVRLHGYVYIGRTVESIFTRLKRHMKSGNTSLYSFIKENKIKEIKKDNIDVKSFKTLNESIKYESMMIFRYYKKDATKLINIRLELVGGNNINSVSMGKIRRVDYDRYHLLKEIVNDESIEVDEAYKDAYIKLDKEIDAYEHSRKELRDIKILGKHIQYR